MPTVTTTVTSACASGVVTTQTTTQATPDPAAAKQTLAEAIKGKTFHGGRLGAIHLVTAKTQKGFDAITAAFQALTGLAQGTDSYVNIIKTGPLTSTNILVFGSEDAFNKIECFFGVCDQTKIAIAEGVEMDVHVMGNLTPSVLAKVAPWNEVPGFSVASSTPSTGYLKSSGGRAGSGDVCGYAGEFTFANEDDMLACMNGRHLGGTLGLSHAVNAMHSVVFYPGSNKCIYFDVFQKDDYLKVLADAAADTVFTPSMIETYSRGSGKHYTFGGNDEINGHLAEWQKVLPTFEINVDCSIGGLDRGDGMCGITVDWFYESGADRDAAQAKFAWLTGIAKQHNVMSFCTIDRGDCGMRMLFIAGSTADWKAVNDFAATDADFGPTVVGKCLMAKATPFGDFSADYYKELFMWEAQAPQFKISDVKPFHHCISSSPYSSSDNTMVGQQVLTFETEALCEASINASIAMSDVWTECGGSVFDFRSSACTYTRIFVFPTPSVLAKANDLFGARPEETAAILKDAIVTTAMFGEETAETKALLDPWRASPTFDIVSFPLKGGFM